MGEIQKKMQTAVKWSAVTEVLSKIISPITQMIFARILAPEAFGVVATVTMVVSFAEMLSDSGFQKYLVQHEYRDENELRRSSNVAFWTNLVLSLLLWGVIAVFNEGISSMVGSPGLGGAIVLASASLPLQSLSSIQLALFKRRLEFRRLLPVRLVVSVVPLVVTVPLVLAGLGYWSLIIGTLCGSFVNAAVLTAISPWKPCLYYSMKLLKEMFSFSVWSLLEALSIWLSTWAGIMVVGSVLGDYYLGLYRMPLSFVNAAMGIVTNATTPVLFSSLSRLQNDRDEFGSVFREFQFNVACLVVPLGVGICIFRRLLTDVLLGPGWEEASLMLGLSGLSLGLKVVLSDYYSEVNRSLGRPRVSLAVQIVYLAIMIPTVYLSARIDFSCLVVVTAAIKGVIVVLNQFSCRHVLGMTAFSLLKNLRCPLSASAGAFIASNSMLLAIGNSITGNIITLLVFLMVYLLLFFVFPEGRHKLLHLSCFISKGRRD